MCKRCLNVCELHPCRATESTNSARTRTIMTAALQWQHLQTEFICWIALLYGNIRLAHSSILTVCDNVGRIKERVWYEKSLCSKNTTVCQNGPYQKCM